MALLGRPLRKTETKSGFHREDKEFSLLMKSYRQLTLFVPFALMPNDVFLSPLPLEVRLQHQGIFHGINVAPRSCLKEKSSMGRL